MNADEMKASFAGPLEWSEEVLQEIVRHTPVGVVLGDVHGTIFAANDAFCSIVGYPREHVVGRAAMSFCFPEDAARASEALAGFLGGRTANGRAVHRIQARSGRAVWVNTTVSRVASSTNEPICLLAFVEDVGERLAIENALRESETLYRQVVENQTDMIVRTDASGIRRFANPAYAKFFGLSESEILGTSAVPLIHEADRGAVFAGIALLSPAEPVRTFTYRVVAAGGSIRWTEWTAHATFDGNERAAVIQWIGRDVTERVRASEDLRANELRYRRLFDGLPGPAWESDWSGLVEYVRGLGVSSKEALLAFTAAHPESVSAGIGRVVALTANSAALALAGAADLAGFSKWLRTAYVPASIPTLIDAVGSIMFDGAMTTRAELSMFGPNGEVRDVDFRWARVRLPQSEWRIINTLADVTDLKQIARDLRRSEQMYRDLFDRLPVAAWEIDWSGPLARWLGQGIHDSKELFARVGIEGILEAAAKCRIIVVNRRALDLTATANADEFSRSRWLVVRPGDIERLARSVAEILFGERESIVLDLESQHPDGRPLNVQMTSTATGFPGRLTNVAVDITERTLAEEALRQSESAYRVLFHHLPVAVWEADWSPAVERWRKDGVEKGEDVVAWLRGGNRTREELKALRRILQVNQNALNLAGAADVDGFANWLATAIRRDDIDRVVPLMANVILGTERRTNVEVQIERCDGVRIDVEIQLVGQEESPGRVISTAVDVTGKKRIERELLHNQALLEDAQAIAHTGSWELNLENDELFGSREYWNIVDGRYGGPQRRKLSAAFESVHPDDRAALRESISRAHDDFVSGRAAERVHEYRTIQPDGSVRIVRGHGVFERTPAGHVQGRGIVQDITEERKAEETAELQREELTRADRLISLGILVSGVAHEINNPNHLIMLDAPLLRSAWADVAPVIDAQVSGDTRVGGLPWSEMRTEVPQIISEIEGGAERIRAIVAELREFGREQRPGELKTQAVNDIVRGSLRLMANHLKKATRNFTLDPASDLPPVDANSQRLEQVIVNLVLNSCQALPGPDAAIRVSTAFNRDAHRVEIRVVDEGVGIKPDDLRKIRDPFFTTKRAEGGMGLGLAVSDRIVQEHHGSLTFESEPGRGTTAVVSLPVAATGTHDGTA